MCYKAKQKITELIDWLFRSFSDQYFFQPGIMCAVVAAFGFFADLFQLLLHASLCMTKVYNAKADAAFLQRSQQLPVCLVQAESAVGKEEDFREPVL